MTRFNREKLARAALGTELTDVAISEISAVDDPAYGEAGWLLMKSKSSRVPVAELVKLLANGEFDHLPLGLEPTTKAARRESLLARVAREGSVRLS